VFLKLTILPRVTKKSGVMKKRKEEYCSDASHDEKAAKADRTSKQNSLEAVELQARDCHSAPSVHGEYDGEPNVRQ